MKVADAAGNSAFLFCCTTYEVINRIEAAVICE
jgi:hypothetical protein